uniref:AMP-binding domain-containing protein n=1 Tax=Caenorhabditis tropicalis TaxID=1561998 RepID=A0A1I7TAF8_9PELO
MLVSSRHFLASTIFELDGTQWFHDGEPVDMNSCNEKGYIEKSSLQNDTNVLKAFIFCNSEMLKSVKNYSVPMIIEVKEQTNQGFACLPTMSTTIVEGNILTSSSYEGPNKLMNYDFKVSKKELIEFTAERNSSFIFAPGDPLFKINGTKWFLVGLRQQSTLTYWNLQYFEKQMCVATGICSEEAIKALTSQTSSKDKITECGMETVGEILIELSF